MRVLYLSIYLFIYISSSSMIWNRVCNFPVHTTRLVKISHRYSLNFPSQVSKYPLQHMNIWVWSGTTSANTIIWSLTNISKNSRPHSRESFTKCLPVTSTSEFLTLLWWKTSQNLVWLLRVPKNVEPTTVRPSKTLPSFPSQTLTPHLTMDPKAHELSLDNIS